MNANGYGARSRPTLDRTGIAIAMGRRFRREHRRGDRVQILIRLPIEAQPVLDCWFGHVAEFSTLGRLLVDIESKPERVLVFADCCSAC